MFILINFGYRCRKIFTIDCLAAAVFDCIWDACYKELLDTYNHREAQWTKETEAHQAKIETSEKRLEVVVSKIKEEEEAAGVEKKKDEKKAAKKGGKDAPIASSPLQQEKIDLEKGIEFSKTAIVKYAEKKTKLGDLKNKLERRHALISEIRQKVVSEKVYIELVDKTGERKFIRTKLEQEASSFLSDKGVYYLCTVTPGDEQEVEALTHQGFAMRTVEEDAAVGQEDVFSVKKDDKGKKGGKKK